MTDLAKPQDLLKHIAAGVQVVICALAVWVATTLQDTQVKLAEVAASLKAVQEQVVTRMQDDIKALDERVRDLEKPQP